MLLFPPEKFQPRKPRRVREAEIVVPETPTPPPPVEPPVLVAAAFDAGTLTLSLTFDRAVDASALVPGEIVVADGPGDDVYADAGAAVPVSPVQIAVPMMQTAAVGGPDVRLTVGAASGVITDGGTIPASEWAGVSDLLLPFPTPPPPPAIVVSAT